MAAPTRTRAGRTGRASARTATERAASGRGARRQAPRSSHAGWQPAPDRADPVSVIVAQETDRVPWLLPLRHARMAESALAFYRGNAAVMAADLAGTPTSGVTVQLCGDAHLANFGTYASPERRQVFDVNDFDETLPGPWEWDVKRLAASFVLAARANGLGEPAARGAAVRAVVSYRRAMGAFAAAGAMEVWYAQASLDLIRSALPGSGRTIERVGAAARRQTSAQALGKLTEQVDGQLRIRSQPPQLVPLRNLGARWTGPDLDRAVRANFREYLASLQPDRRHLLSRFRLVDVASKAVGVGSVGTRCFVGLLQGNDHDEPLFLQVKQASEPVAAAYLPTPRYPHQGQRVVEGQRLIQTSSDIFLGWSQQRDGPHYYWRQLRDMKGSVDTTTMGRTQLELYADVCGWTLAHAHARSGDAVAIAAYLGSGSVFDQALGDFAVAYADQAERDHAAFVAAIAAGRLGADPG